MLSSRQQQQETRHFSPQTTVAMVMMYTSVSQQWKGCFQQMKYVGTLAFRATNDRAVCLPIIIRLGGPPIEYLSADPFT